jgi:hypothetical protein
MNFAIFSNGKQYFMEPMPPGIGIDAIWAKHPDCRFVDNADSEEEAERKIRQDRDRHRPFWF